MLIKFQCQFLLRTIPNAKCRVHFQRGDTKLPRLSLTIFPTSVVKTLLLLIVLKFSFFMFLPSFFHSFIFGAYTFTDPSNYPFQFPSYTTQNPLFLHRQWRNHLLWRSMALNSPTQESTATHHRVQPL